MKVIHLVELEKEHLPSAKSYERVVIEIKNLSVYLDPSIIILTKRLQLHILSQNKHCAVESLIHVIDGDPNLS